MIFNNKLKIALVTGGTKGVGKELAKMFKKNNYNVIITGRNESNAINVADELNSNDRYSNGIVKGYKLDFTDIINSKKILNKLDNKDIKPTFLINNAGTLNTKNIDNITLKNFDNLLKVNTIGPMLYLNIVLILLDIIPIIILVFYLIRPHILLMIKQVIFYLICNLNWRKLL